MDFLFLQQRHLHNGRKWGHMGLFPPTKQHTHLSDGSTTTMFTNYNKVKKIEEKQNERRKGLGF
jgi:hypothetical protein